MPPSSGLKGEAGKWRDLDSVRQRGQGGMGQSARRMRENGISQQRIDNVSDKLNISIFRAEVAMVGS
jgi:hypothetical protein